MPPEQVLTAAVPDPTEGFPGQNARVGRPRMAVSAFRSLLFRRAKCGADPGLGDDAPLVAACFQAVNRTFSGWPDLRNRRGRIGSREPLADRYLTKTGSETSPVSGFSLHSKPAESISITFPFSRK